MSSEFVSVALDLRFVEQLVEAPDVAEVEGEFEDAAVAAMDEQR